LKYWKCLPRKCGFFENTGNIYQENPDFLEILEMFTKKMWIFFKYWKYLPRKSGFFGNTGNVYRENLDFFGNTGNVYQEILDFFW